MLILGFKGLSASQVDFAFNMFSVPLLCEWFELIIQQTIYSTTHKSEYFTSNSLDTFVRLTIQSKLKDYL